MAEDIVDEPRVTANASLFLGFIAAAITSETNYQVVGVDRGYLICESVGGNRFRVQAEQISGVE